MKQIITIACACLMLGAFQARPEGTPPGGDGRPDRPPRSGQDAGGDEGRGGQRRPRGGAQDVPFARDFFAPELVLRNQVAIGLTTTQVDALKKLINDAHAQVLDLQADLERDTELFKQTLDKAKVDEVAALAQADRMLALEVRMKRAQLALLVRVKNLLTEAQQAKLRALRAPDGAADEPR